MAFNEIRRFGRIAEPADVGALMDIQRISYDRFLQQNLSDDQRESVGLNGLLQEIFPIVSYDENMRLEYLGYELGKPR